MRNANELQQLKEMKDALEYDEEAGCLRWIKTINSRAIKGNIAGTTLNTGYIRLRYKGQNHRVHRIIFYLCHGYVPKFIDHLNGDKTDNRIENLREATPSENQCNVGLTSKNTSGVKGVTWCDSLKKWRCRMYLQKESRSFGCYRDFFEACCAIHSARNRLHGEFVYHGTH